ncbi:MAG TPA: group 1 truncated hemoglobin [Casimicrobiaceae bacterium]|nr:group 1 truncated hemoglobin [Casimicrobiaceae bacterium]
MNAMRKLTFPMLLGMALLLGACQDMGMMPMQHKSLYERLGGKDAIVAVVDDFVGNVAADNRINHFFAKTDIPRLKKNLVDQICQATGGPCVYTGRDMVTAHSGMGVSNADFDALVGDLVKTLDKFKVPEKEKGELLAILGPMRPQIVGH